MSRQSLFRQTARFFSGTLLSRISGMVRDITMAYFFGTHPDLAAFMLSFRFVYLIRRLFGEGLLHQGFVPYYEKEKQRSLKAGGEFFRDLFWSFFLILLLSICLIEGGLGLSLPLLSSNGHQMVVLAMRLLPGIFCICLFGLSSGFLHSENHFFLSSASGALANGVWIFGMIFLSRLSIDQAVAGLTLIVTLAFLAQWGITLPKIYGHLRKTLSLCELFRAHLFSEKIRSLKKPLLLGIVGVASVQINSAVDAVFARLSDSEGPAYLWYAIRMQQLPLSLFGVALSSALLPALSRALQQGDYENYLALMHVSLKRTFSLIFPCVIGIFVLGASSVNLLFGRGDFGRMATHQTSLCLMGYGLGLLPFALIQVFAPAFYAKGDYKTPAIVSMSSALINVGLNALFVFLGGFKAASVALATSLSALYNVLVLYLHLYRSDKRIWHSTLSVSMLKISFCALFSGLFVCIFGALFLQDPTFGIFLGKAAVTFSRNFSDQLILFSSQAGIYVLLFFSFCKIFGAREVMMLLKKDTYSSK